MARYCWLDGKIVSEKVAKVSVLDRGLLLGEGLFETMRAYNGRVFALSRHYKRLSEGAKVLGITVPGLREIEDGIYDLLEANKLKDARVRLTVTSGPGGPGLLPEGPTNPTVIILAHPLEALPTRILRRGARATILPIRKIARSPLGVIKTTSYAENVLGRRLAKQAGADEGIFLNTEGDLCEGTASNIFLVKFGKLFTPDLASGCLPGVTRAVVLEIAPKAGLEPEETSLSPIDLADTDEAFLTSSTREIVPLTVVDGETVGTGRPGEATAALAQRYRELVLRQCPPKD
jgi:branched-chain amino acid aminotransferase